MTNDSQIDERSISIEQSVTDSAVVLGDGNIVTVTTNNIIQILADTIKTLDFIKTSPYQGLKKFKQEDSDRFFGREQFCRDKLMKPLEKTNIILLLGASGSGKSSVVGAGMIPSFKTAYGNKFINLTFTPSRNPFKSLDRVLHPVDPDQLAEDITRTENAETLTRIVKQLKQPDQFWLIFIDQLEELFTMSDSDTCKSFLESLVHLIKLKLPLVKIVATMRTDFLDRLSHYPDLVKLTDGYRPLMTEMYTDELRIAIEQPAAHHGVVFQSGLVNEIIRDVKGQAGCLPLLQYALDLLWQEESEDPTFNTRRTLRTETYRQLEGVRGALQKRVEQIYNDLKEPEKNAAQRILLKLVEIGGDTAAETDWKPVRRRALRSEFNGKTQERVLNLFIKENLLISDIFDPNAEQSQSTVEIAHEILLTSWETLNTWIKENRQTIALRNRLYGDVRLWIEKKKRNDDLWNGAKLEQVNALRADTTFNQVLGGFNSETVEFIEASNRLSKRQMQERIAAEDDRRTDIMNLLEACTVKLVVPDQDESSTGFFVAPGKILTCASKILEVGAQPIKVFWNDGDSCNINEATIDRLFQSNNLAILKLTHEANHSCVYLDTHVEVGDSICTYGYSSQVVKDGYGHGKCQKRTEKDRRIIEFATYQNSMKLESSPLLNLRTLTVCGIVQSSHSKNIIKPDKDQVTMGKAISTAAVLATVDSLKKEQKTFHTRDRRWSNLFPPRCKPLTVALTSLGMATLVILVRAFQVFQPLELGFYDALMRSRLNPPKPSDRFLIVHITKEDADAQRERGEVLDYSLSNKTLLALLEKVEAMADDRKPIAVGLDIYRDEALTHLNPSEKQQLETLFKESGTLFTICKSPDSEGRDGVLPPPGVKAEQVGFSDFSIDNDGVLRRHLLAFNSGTSASSPCKPATSSDQSIQSFNLLIANRYLQHYWQQQEAQITVDSSEQTCQIQFSNGVTLPNLPLNTGGYQGYAGEKAAALFNGCQLLLNYRHPHQQYQTITLQQFLDTDLSEQDYSNRIILIGIDRSDGISDNFRTPYDQRSDDVTTGVVIHAHMIDQIVDAAIEGTSTLIWVLPSQIDLLLILTAALIGGGLGWLFLSPRRLGIWVTGIGGSLLLISVAVFQGGGWVPLMPHFLAMSATSGCVFWVNMRLRSVTSSRSAKATPLSKATNPIAAENSVKP